MRDALNFTAIVGSSFSGKSTLLSDLAQNNNSQVATIAEYCEYAGGNKNFRQLPFVSEEDARGNIDDFLKLERLRQNDAQKIKNKTPSPVIMDRTIYCFLLMQLLLKKKFPNWRNSFQYGVKKLTEAINANMIELPSKLILLEPADKKTFLSRTKRGTSVALFTDPKTWHFFSQAYRNIIKGIYSRKQSLILISRNTPESRQQLVSQTKNFLRSNQSDELISAKKFSWVFNALGDDYNEY